MSDFLSVGGVTAVLAYLLANAPGSGELSPVLTISPAITAQSPDMIEASASEPGQLNLFMYYVSLNPALRNLDLPSVDAAGNPVGNPPLALDLHYLVSAYGGGFLTAEVLLGWAMKVFHDNPVVAGATIEEALTNPAGGSSPAAGLVADSSLAKQIEHLRITPQTLTTEEIYRLWPAFQAPYRPSTAYQVSVVVIQDTTPVMSGPPVRHRRILALPLQSPVISGVSPLMAIVGDTLTITGANFLGPAMSDTVVSFDHAAPIAATLVQGTVVKVVLPSTLQAGTRTVRVQRTVTFPRETTNHQGFSSSPVPFQLLPAIQDSSPMSATLGQSLTLTISPPVGRTQQATVCIGDQAIPLEPRPLTDPATSATLTFSVPAAITAGTYPIRVEIDGASSLLTQQPSGQWTPQVVVT
jgi:Pvc16 N-terminal domain/IPT/TIG domain